MPHRSYASTVNYRFGFNGKENDNEPKGLGNQQDYGSRIYDPRIARWLSLDPLQKKYPGESNYAFVGNSPLLFEDEDGKDKVVTITIIGRDGTKMEIRSTDESYFEYYTDRMYNGFHQAYKADRHINLTIDFSKSATELSFALSLTSERVNRKGISNFEYSKIPDVLDYMSNIFSESKEKETEKFGFRILGSSSNTKWTDGLPKPAEGSESLNLKGWLELAGGLKGENAEYEEKVLKMFSVMLLGDKVEKVGKLGHAANVLENSSKVAETLEHLISNYKELHGNEKESGKKITNLQLTKEINNKYGNEENKPWKGGTGRTISKERDSGNKAGDTIYRVRTVYKRN